MSKLLTAAFTITAMLAASPVGAQPTPIASGSMAPSAPPTAGGLPAVRHLVYEFGYNQKAASQGNNTGTTTIDIVGLAKDGGMTVKATDHWWNEVHPKQSSMCEVYPNGGVTCGQAPYSLTVIQLAVLPFLGHGFFSALSAGLNSSWKQNFDVKATFTPGAGGMGFAGQVYTWNCALTLNGKGTLSEQPPLIQIQSNGTFSQQGGRYTKFNQKAGILFDPRIKMPVYVSQLLQLVPQQSVNSYAVEVKLIKYQ
jgi:hypothetical protein